MSSIEPCVFTEFDMNQLMANDTSNGSFACDGGGGDGVAIDTLNASRISYSTNSDSNEFCNSSKDLMTSNIASESILKAEVDIDPNNYHKLMQSQMHKIAHDLHNLPVCCIFFYLNIT